MAPQGALVGRDTELATIERFLETLDAGASVLAIEGEAGIGKTSLLGAAMAGARARDVQVLVARPVEAEASVGFTVLRDLLGGVSAAVIHGLPPPQSRAMAGALLREDLDERPDPRAIGAATLSILRELARTAPVLLVIDDATAIDTPSAQALGFGLRRLEGEPIGTIACVRTEWSATRPASFLDALGSDRIRWMRLGPLEDVAVREVLARAGHLPTDRALVGRLLETAAGNPFFALELAAVLRAAPELPPHRAVPPSLRSIVSAHVAGLSARTLDVMRLAAFSSDPSVLLQVPEEHERDALVRAVDEAVAAGVLHTKNQLVRFTHPLIRSAVADEASPAQRRAAHRRLAAIAVHPEERARHLALAATGPDPDTAALLEAAADDADRRGASAAAAELAELAVDLTPARDAGAARRRRICAADYKFRAGDPFTARDLLRRVVEEMAPGVHRAGVLLRLGGVLRYCGEPMGECRAVFEQGLAEASDDPGLQGRLHLEASMAVATTGDSATAEAYLRDALDEATAAGDVAVVAAVRAGQAFTGFMSGRGVDEGLVAAALAVPDEPTELTVDLRPAVALAHVLHWADDLDRARQLCEREYARAALEGRETDLGPLISTFVELELFAGRWDRAERLAEHAGNGAELTGTGTAFAFALTARGLVHAHRGRVDAARRDAERAMATWASMHVPMGLVMTVHVLAFVDLSLGDAAAAHARLAPAVQMMQALGIPEPGVARMVPDDIEALVRLGELAAARSLLDVFEVRAEELKRQWARGAAARCRALLLAAEGRHDVASEAVERALEIGAGLGMPFERGRTLLVAAEVHRRSRRRRAAAEAIEAASSVFRSLGAELWVAQAEAERGRLGMGGPGAGPIGLTPTERRVAELAALGRTNREIASELFMGQRTVEAHLSRVFRKVGVRSRTELVGKLPSA